MRSVIRSALVLAALGAAGKARAERDNYSDVMRGKALVTIGDCIACHTAPGGTPFAGGFALQTPFGPIMTPNSRPMTPPASAAGRRTISPARCMRDGGRTGPISTRHFPIPITPR